MQKSPLAIASAAADVRSDGLAPWRIYRLRMFVEAWKSTYPPHVYVD